MIRLMDFVKALIEPDHNIWYCFSAKKISPQDESLAILRI